MPLPLFLLFFYVIPFGNLLLPLFLLLFLLFCLSFPAGNLLIARAAPKTRREQQPSRLLKPHATRCVAFRPGPPAHPGEPALSLPKGRENSRVKSAGRRTETPGKPHNKAPANPVGAARTRTHAGSSMGIERLVAWVCGLGQSPSPAPSTASTREKFGLLVGFSVFFGNSLHSFRFLPDN